MSAAAILDNRPRVIAMEAAATYPALVAWLPLATLPPAVVMATPNTIPRWMLMWLMVFAIYTSFKWLSWATATRPTGKVLRKILWWTTWPGTEVERFLGDPADPDAIRPSAVEWTIATAKTVAGIALFAFALFSIQHGWQLEGAWCGMIGLALILHFGAFHLISCGYRFLGIDARPVMDRPLMSQSLGEFWGRRWNRAFHDTAHTTVFRPLAKRVGPIAAMWAVFVLSGIVHEAGISVTARAVYGLPTLYFLLQAAALTVQDSPIGKRWSLDRGLVGRAITLLTVFAPAPILFPLPFIHRVVVPMMRAIGSI